MDEEMLLPLAIGARDDDEDDMSNSSESNERDDFIQNGIVHSDDDRSSSSSYSTSDEENSNHVDADGRPSTRSSQNSEGSSHYRSRAISYDRTLPTQHSYLGRELQELKGRVIIEESYVTIPLLSFPGVVLVPGQLVPLQVQHPSLVSMMKNIIENEQRTFGLTSSSPTCGSPALGTTAEILSFGYEEDRATDYILTTLTIKAEGRQRFIVKDTWRPPGGILMGKVKILSEVNLVSPVTDCSAWSRRTAAAKVVPHLTLWPRFVYEQYNAQWLMDAIKKQLENWVTFESAKTQSQQPKPPDNRKNEITATQKQVTTGTSAPQQDQPVTIRSVRTVTMTIETREVDSDEEEESSDEEEQPADSNSSARTKAPKKPSEFSYWVTSNLPLSDAQRVEVLSLSCCVQRLRWLHSVLSKYTSICCGMCETRICNRGDVFSMSAQGPQAAYVNPSGTIHETLTVMRASSLVLEGRPTTEYSWFPGYAWTTTSCSVCASHIGWKFTAVDKALQPEQFWGITRLAVQLALRPDPFEETGSNKDASNQTQNSRWHPII